MSIRSGAHCISLMHALATRDKPQIELLKITAIGTTLQTKIEETGNRLSCFAQALNIPFHFNTVMVNDLEHIDENLFDKSVVIVSRFLLRHTLTQPGSLESMMRVLNNLNPCIVVIAEFETNHKSRISLDCFSQALTYCTTFFDCLEDCMDKTEENWKVLEGSYLGEDIKTIVQAGNDDRIFMDMKIEERRSVSIGMIETELSSSAFVSS